MKKRIWANLLSLGTHMWSDRDVTDTLKFDERVWQDLTERSKAIGINMVVIDLGEGIVYPSHPELQVKGSWTPGKLKKALARLRAMGLEPIPRINLSACHDAWLGDYSRMLCTDEYYRAVSEIIADVVRLFERPRFVHIGMDEEVARLQKTYDYAQARQGNLWWHDVNYFVREVEKNGSRAWVWADPAWCDTDYVKRMPRSAVQSNWFYWGNVPELEKKVDLPPPPNEVRPDSAYQNTLVELRTFLDLERAKFDQIPSATNWDNPENMYLVTDFCLRRIPQERLLGFLMETWEFTIPDANVQCVHDEYFKLLAPIIRKFG